MTRFGISELHWFACIDLDLSQDLQARRQASWPYSTSASRPAYLGYLDLDFAKVAVAPLVQFEMTLYLSQMVRQSAVVVMVDLWLEIEVRLCQAKIVDDCSKCGAVFSETAAPPMLLYMFSVWQPPLRELL